MSHVITHKRFVFWSDCIIIVKLSKEWFFYLKAKFVNIVCYFVKRASKWWELNSNHNMNMHIWNKLHWLTDIDLNRILKRN